MDCGFFSEATISTIEFQRRANYLIKVKLKNLNDVLSEQQWESILGMSGWGMCDFYYKPKSWQKERRFVALRRLKKVEKEGRLFPRKDYEYFCYVTDIYDSPLYIHRLYGDRGESENWIEGVKNQLFAGNLLKHGFWATEALWLCSILAYNLLVCMRKLSDESSWREEPATFRRWFVQLAGKIVSTGRRTYLSMYKAYYYKARWRQIEIAIELQCSLRSS